MSDPYIGEIQAFGFSFAPAGWLPCYGQLLSIQQYSPLYSLIGTSFGGNGTTNFALPNLVGIVAMSQGHGPGLSNYFIGMPIGSETVNVMIAEMPAHSHTLQLGDKASANSTAAPTAGTSVAIDPTFNGFLPPPADTPLAFSAMGSTGGSQAHPNNQPTLAMIYCIATVGQFPSFN